MPILVRKKQGTIGAQGILGPMLEVTDLELTLDRDGKVISEMFTLEDGKRYPRTSLTFDSVDKDELTAFEMEAKMRARKLPMTAGEYLRFRRKKKVR